MHHLSIDDPTLYFQDLRDQCLSSAQSGCCTDLNFVSKSGEMVSAHQALLLPLSSHLKLLVESSKSCGCVEDVPTLFLPDWGHEIIEALVNFLYSASITVTDDVNGELTMLMNELRFDLSPDQFITELLVDSPAYTVSHSNSGNSPIPIEEALAAENRMSTISSIKLENTSYNNKTEQKIGWIHNTAENHETEKEEHERMIKKLSKMLVFFDQSHTQNKEAIKKSLEKTLDELLTSLKYFPTNPSFAFLPMEIKSHILDYLCDTGFFVAASVCLEWKELFKKRIQREAYRSTVLTEIMIGRHCSNLYSCEEDMCFMPEEILKASSILKLDFRLNICHPVLKVDSKLLAEELSNVSEFSITDNCYCGDDGEFKQMLMLNQMKMLFDTIANKNETMRSIELDMNMISLYQQSIYLDQDWLINCLMQVNRLLLSDNTVLNPTRFVENLLQSTTDPNISELYMETINGSTLLHLVELAEDLANALCRIETIYLGFDFDLHDLSRNQFVSNILTQRIRMENLFIFNPVDWRRIDIEDLIVIFAELKRFLFYGDFTSDQVEAAISMPDVYVEPGVHFPDIVDLHLLELDYGHESKTLIKKGIYIDKSQIMSSDFCLADIFFKK